MWRSAPPALCAASRVFPSIGQPSIGALSGTGKGPLSDSPAKPAIFTSILGWSRGTRMKAMSKLICRFLSPPTEATILSESGWTFDFEMSSFQALFFGKTWRAARMGSASGALNITGSLNLGIGGRRAPGADSSLGAAPKSPFTKVNAFFVSAATATGGFEQSRTSFTVRV